MHAYRRIYRIAGALALLGLSTYTVHAADRRPFASSDFTSLHSALPVAVSPDGHSILFEVRSFGEKGPAKHEWNLLPAAGGDAKKLDLPETFTPGGYTKEGALFGEYRIEDQAQLAIVPLANGKPTVIFTLPRGSRAAAISPDGARIAVLADARPKDKHDEHNVVDNDESSLYVFNLNSRDGSWWCPELRFITDFAWSKTSNRLAVITQLPKLGNHDAHSALHVCSVDNAQQLADVPTMTAGLAWSKDEKELVFAATKTATLTAEHVWTMSLSGGTPTDRTPDLNGTAETVHNHRGTVLVEVHRGVLTEIDRFEDGKLTPTLSWHTGITIGMPALNPFPDTPDVEAVGVGDPNHTPTWPSSKMDNSRK